MDHLLSFWAPKGIAVSSQASVHPRSMLTCRKGTFFSPDVGKRVNALDRTMEVEKAQIFVLFIAVSLTMKSYLLLEMA